LNAVTLRQRFIAVLCQTQKTTRIFLARQEAEKAESARLAALPVTETDFTVDVTRDGKGVIITGYKGKSTAVKIPAAIQEFPVLQIGERAFWENRAITSVVIPQGVASINANAFTVCTSLASLTIPGSVTAIGSDAFRGCASPASITIPGSVKEIGESAFRDCASLTTVTISPIKRSWLRFTFSGCKASLASQSAIRAAGYTDEF
jgi:hypothetical protein